VKLVKLVTVDNTRLQGSEQLSSRIAFPVTPPKTLYRSNHIPREA